jgi:pimeloyl-ACP methyl ester carboxylesterase
VKSEQEHLSAYPFVATVISFLCGCAPANDFQPAQELADLDQAASTLEWRAQRFPAGTFQNVPFHLALHECGPASAESTFIFLPGIVSDSRVWKLVCAGMPPRTLRVCIDTLGCGQSDTPRATGPGQTLYEPTEMARQVLETLRQWNARRDTRSAPRWTLVAHSFAGQIAVRMLCDAELRERYGDVLNNIHAVVLLAPFDPGTWVRQQRYERIITTTDLGWWLAGATGGIRKMGRISPRGAVCSSRQLPEDRATVAEILSDPARRQALKAKLMQAFPVCPGTPLDDPEPDWVRIRSREAEYARLTIPCLIVWGYEDELLTHVTGYKLLTLLPNARLRIIIGCKHQIPIEQPTISKDLIVGFANTPIEQWARFETIDAAMPARGEELDGRMSPHATHPDARP